MHDSPHRRAATHARRRARSCRLGLEPLEHRIQPSAWVDADLSAQAGGPNAAGAAYAYITPDGPTARVVYPAADGQVHELYLQPGQTAWIDYDLSAAAHGPATASQPYGYVSLGPTSRVGYNAADGHVHELLLTAGQPWRDADLTALAHGPNAMSAPFGYETPDGTARVVYTAADGHIHELYLQPGAPTWVDGDLSAQGHGPQATSAVPYAYVTPDGPTYRVVYTGVDGDIHELNLQPRRTWADADLSAQAGGPHVVSGAVGLVTPGGPTARVVYAGADGDVHQLSLSPHQAWVDTDLTVAGGGVGTTAGLAAYVSPDGPTVRVVYTGVDSDVHELALSQGQGWADTDLTVAGGGVGAVGAPFGYVTPDGPTAHVVYRGADGDIHDLSLVPGADTRSGREIATGIRALSATASASTASMPAEPGSGKDSDILGLRLESAGIAASDARPAEAWTEVFTRGDPAQGLSWQPVLLPLEGLDTFYELSGN
jgi:hypothetical protein